MSVATSKPKRASATPTQPKRRGTIDTLVARDRTAVFWFLAACIVATSCAYYISIMASALKQRPPFVVMDTSGAYYVPPGILYRDNIPMHLQMANIFAETLLERTPEGLVYADRLDKLYWENDRREFPALAQVRDELKKEDKFFTSQNVTQTVDIEGTTIPKSSATRVGTITTGTVLRRSTFSGKEKLESYRFTLTVIWHQNLRILANKGFPSQVETLTRLKLDKISDQ